MSLAITILFKDIFATYEDFKSWITSFTDTTDEFSVFILPLIYDYYVNSNVRYDTAEAFKRHFKITYLNIFRKWKKKHELLGSAYSISTGELDLINKQVNVLANNDNSEVTNPLDTVLDFVSTQSISKQTKNKLMAYYEAIDNLKEEVIDDYIRDLSIHFIKVCEPVGYYFCDEEEA